MEKKIVYSDILKQEFENQEELDKAELAYYRQKQEQEKYGEAAVKAMFKWLKKNCGIDERCLRLMIESYKEHCEVSFQWARYL